MPDLPPISQEEVMRIIRSLLAESELVDAILHGMDGAMCDERLEHSREG